MSSFDDAMAELDGVGATAPPPAPANSFDAAMAELDGPREYTTEEALGDVGKSAAVGVNKAGEFLADAAALPMTTTMRHLEGMKNAFTGTGGGILSRYWEGLTSDDATKVGGKKVGDWTQETFNPRPDQADYVEEMTVPEGEGPAWLQPAKTATEYGVEGVVTAPLGGAKYVVSGLKAALGMAGGSAIGEKAGGDTGEAIGVITGALASDPKALLDLYRAGASIAGKVKGKVGSYIMKADGAADATDAQLLAGMEEYIRNALPADPEVAEETLKQLMPKLRKAIADGELGTTGQILDDAGVLQLERDFAKEHRLNDLKDMNARIETGARDPIRAVAPEGVTADAAKPIRAELGEAIDDIGEQQRTLTRTMAADDTAQLTASQSAQEAANAPFPADLPDTAETASALYKTQEAAKKKSLDIVKQEFKKLGGTATDAATVKNSVNVNFLKDPKVFEDEAARNLFTESFSGSMDFINNKLGKGDVSVDSLSDLIAMINSEANMIKKGSKQGTALQKLDAFKESIYEAIDIAGGDPAVRKKAGAMYRAHMEKFADNTAVGKGLKKDPQQFNAVLQAGDEGLPAFKQMEQGDRAASAAAEKALRSLFKQEVTNQVTGEMGSAAGFLKKYKQQLDMFPDLRDEIKATTTASDRLAASQAASKSTAKEIAAVKKAADKQVEGVKKSEAYKFSDIDDAPTQVVKQVRKLMNSPKPAQRLQDLNKLLKGYAPEAKENLRRAIMDDFVNTIEAGKNTKKAGQLTQGGYRKFKADRPTYEASGLFTTKELDNIEKGLAEGQKMFLHDNAERLAKLPPVKRRVAETVAAIGGAKLGAQTMGSPLIGAALGRKAAVSWLDSVTDAQAKKIAYELSINPEKFVEVFDRLNDQALTAAERAGWFKKLTDIATQSAAVVAIEDE